MGTLTCGAISAVVMAQDGAATDGRVVATVGDRTIRLADVREELMSERRQALAAHRLEPYTSGAAERALNALVNTKVLALAAHERGLDVRADIRRRLDNVIDEFLAATLIQTLLEESPISDDKVKAYFEAHRAEFTPHGRVRARHIVVRTRDEAEALASELRRGASFEALAREHNTDSTRATGGELGWVKPGVMVKPFEDALFALQPGEVSPIVQTSFGFHLIRVEVVEAVTPPRLEAVQDAVRQRMLEGRLAELKRDLSRKYGVSIDQQALQSLGR